MYIRNVVTSRYSKQKHLKYVDRSALKIYIVDMGRTDTMTTKMGIVELAQMTEDDARAMLERIRWPDGIVCPHCGAVNESTKIQGRTARPGLHKCRGCRRSSQ